MFDFFFFNVLYCTGRNRGESIDSRVSKLREVRVVQPSSLQHCKNERMMLLTPKTKIPFYVFSFIPYKKPPKRYEIIFC